MPESQHRRRSELVVPAMSPRHLASAARSAADSVVIDLEDAVAPSCKAQARLAASQALASLEWGSRRIGVRINTLASGWGLDDLLCLMQGARRPEMIVLPKVSCPEDVIVLASILDAMEASDRMGDGEAVRISVLIESAAGIAAVAAIARASPRIDSLIFGIGDYLVDTGARVPLDGTAAAGYGVSGVGTDGRVSWHLGDLCHHALSTVLLASRAAGLAALDGPFARIADDDGFEASARKTATMGFDGKWLIHPRQIAPANRLFSPTEAQVIWAREIRGLLSEGGGVATHNGTMIDTAHVRFAERILAAVEDSEA